GTIYAFPHDIRRKADEELAIGPMLEYTNEVACIWVDGIAFANNIILQLDEVIKNFSVNSFTSPGERRAVTPRKYKSMCFVRCKNCRSLPCPAGIARVRRPHKTA